jgi:dienelactone hydrolase
MTVISEYREFGCLILGGRSSGGWCVWSATLLLRPYTFSASVCWFGSCVKLAVNFPRAVGCSGSQKLCHSHKARGHWDGHHLSL